MNKDITVVVTSAGAGPGIAVIKALEAQQELKLKIIAADMDPTAAGLYLADEHMIIPAAKDPHFIDEIIKKCKWKKVDLIIPIFDLETPIFAQAKQRIKKEAGAEVLVNDYDVIDICNDKLKSHGYAEAKGIKVPILNPDESPHFEDTDSIRTIAKPISGVGSKGIHRFKTRQEVETARLQYGTTHRFWQEIEGIEYSIDTLSDSKGHCLVACPRERIVVKAGQMVKGCTTKDKELVDWGKNVADAFRLKGAGCIQVKKRDEDLFFIEVNPRYGTGLSLTVGAGLNIPLLHIKLTLGIKIKKEEFDFKDNYYVSRYWEEVF